MSASPRRRRRGAAVLLVVGAVLQLPVVLLAAHDVGALTGGVDDLSYLSSLIGASLVGVAAALSVRAGVRLATALGAVVSLLLAASGFALAVLFPPPFVVHRPPPGVPSLFGLLNAAYLVLIVGGGTSALVLTAAHLAQTARAVLRR